MAKPDPALLDPARYPFHCTMETRFGDLDLNRHLNNVALVGIMEDGRVRFHRASGFNLAKQGLAAMVASFAIEYLGQAWYPQLLDMHVAVAHVGRTSFVLHQLVCQEDRVVSFAQSVIVCVADHQPALIPAAYIDDIDQWMLRP
jgi:acyl-CoA thioester hydrolase